jgi:hypothetical protein
VCPACHKLLMNGLILPLFSHCLTSGAQREALDSLLKMIVVQQ